MKHPDEQGSSSPVQAVQARRPWRAPAFTVLAALLLAALVLGLSHAWSPPPRDPLRREHLRIAVPSVPHAALIHLASAQGFFADEGLDVRTLPCSHGKAALDMLAQGQAELAAAAELPFVLLVMKGQDLAVLATISSATTEMAVVARDDRGIDQGSALRGKRIGVTLGTSAEYFLASFLVRQRLPRQAVHLVDLLPEQLGPALAEGRVDAIAAWQPMRAQALQALDGRARELTEADAYTATYILVGHGDYLRDHPDTSRRVLRALLRAEDYLRQNPSRALEQLSRQLRLDLPTLSPAWRDQQFRVDLLQPQLITMEDEASWASESGYVSAHQEANFLPRFRLDALLAERPDRVTVVH